MRLENPADHFLRYCNHTQVDNGKISRYVFYRKVKNDVLETGISGDHFEHFPKGQLSGLLSEMQYRHFTPKKNGYLIKVRCGTVIKAFESKCAISFEKENENHSHTEMLGFENEFFEIMPKLDYDILAMSNII